MKGCGISENRVFNRGRFIHGRIEISADLPADHLIACKTWVSVPSPTKIDDAVLGISLRDLERDWPDLESSHRLGLRRCLIAIDGGYDNPILVGRVRFESRIAESSR